VGAGLPVILGVKEIPLTTIPRQQARSYKIKMQGTMLTLWFLGESRTS
jgi:hypothetical protein